MSPPALRDISTLPQEPSDFPDFVNRWPMQCHLQEHFVSYPDGALPPGEISGVDDRPSENWAGGALSVTISEVSSSLHSLRICLH